MSEREEFGVFEPSHPGDLCKDSNKLTYCKSETTYVSLRSAFKLKLYPDAFDGNVYIDTVELHRPYSDLIPEGDREHDARGHKYTVGEQPYHMI